MTSPFWQTIERIPGHATDTRDWRSGMADCWDVAKPYLPEISKFVDRIDCPWPGGEHCPRRVVRHSEGAVRAVCGDPVSQCHSIELELEDIRIRELDRRKLLADIAVALDLVRLDESALRSKILHVGDHAISAGRAFPVFAALASPRMPIGKADVLDLNRRNLPFILLVTSLGTLETDVVSFLSARQGRVLTFGECLAFSQIPRKGFVVARPPAELFAPEIGALRDEITDASPLVLDLPRDVKWSDVRFTFVSSDVINVSYRKQHMKRIEPKHLGMHSQKDGTATRQWRLLQLCAALQGALPRHFPVHTIRGQRPSAEILRAMKEFQKGYDRQRQLLAAALKQHFGIDEAPFKASDDCYDAQFLVDASGLLQGRADQRNRNFADDD